MAPTSGDVPYVPIPPRLADPHRSRLYGLERDEVQVSEVTAWGWQGAPRPGSSGTYETCGSQPVRAWDFWAYTVQERWMTPLAAHLAKASSLYKAWCRDNGYKPLPELDQLVFLVSAGHSETTPHEVIAFEDDARVPLALQFDEAGRQIGVSGKTIDRLVKARTLKAVLVGKARRIPRSELERYINAQLEEA